MVSPHIYFYRVRSVLKKLDLRIYWSESSWVTKVARALIARKALALLAMQALGAAKAAPMP